MEDESGEGEHRAHSWVYLRQSNLEVEYPVAVRGVGWPRDRTSPVQHLILIVGDGGACRQRVVLEVDPLLSDSS